MHQCTFVEFINEIIFSYFLFKYSFPKPISLVILWAFWEEIHGHDIYLDKIGIKKDMWFKINQFYIYFLFLPFTVYVVLIKMIILSEFHCFLENVSKYFFFIKWPSEKKIKWPSELSKIWNNLLYHVLNLWEIYHSSFWK